MVLGHIIRVLVTERTGTTPLVNSAGWSPSPAVKKRRFLINHFLSILKNKIDGYYEAKLMYYANVTKLKLEGIRGTGKAIIELAEEFI